MNDIMSEPGEQLRANCFNASHALAKAAYAYRDGNPWPEINPLNDVVEHFVTEIWDWTFSQAEIREAFESALAGLTHYAAGEEKRC